MAPKRQPIPGVEAFTKRLSSDRLIPISVGESHKNGLQLFQVPQSMLEDVSPYFTRALKQGAFREGKEGVLMFPDDDRQIWEVFIYWLFKKEIPEMGSIAKVIQRALVRCWCFGDKYEAIQFQDRVMWSLLRFYRTGTTTVETIKEAYKATTTSAKLRRLMAEEAVYLLNQDSAEHSDFKSLDGTGFMSEFMRACYDWEQDTDRFQTSGEERALWKTYMTGGEAFQPFGWVMEEEMGDEDGEEEDNDDDDKDDEEEDNE